MDRQSQAAQLTQLSAIRFRAAQAEMAQLRLREDRLRSNLAQLIQQKETQADAMRDGAAAIVAGADVRWHQWVDQRRTVINAELAQVRALQEGCRAKLSNAFGRDQAVQDLNAKLTAEAKFAQQRRKSYES